jgi:hypothetical protein
MAGAIRYCTSSDGTRIAYGTDGDGPALIELGAAWESALTGEMKWVRDAYAPVRHGRTVVYGLGLTGIPVYNVNNNCSTGSTALFMGKQLHCSARSASST